MISSNLFKRNLWNGKKNCRVSDLSKKAESKTGQLYQEYLKVMHKDAMRLVNEVRLIFDLW